MHSIFNSWLEMDCFCLDIAEGWIKYRQEKNKSVDADAFMNWVMDNLVPALESNFEDVYDEMFDEEEEE